MDGGYTAPISRAEEVSHNMARLGHEWADKECAASLLEETRKSVRAQYAMEHFGDAKTIGKAELMAEADERYIEHINKMVIARKAANIGKVNFDSCKAWIDLIRSQEASRRAEMTMR